MALSFEALRKLREEIPISIGDAKAVLSEHPHDFEVAIESAKKIFVKPVADATGCEIGDCFAALKRTNGDVSKAITFLNWKNDPQGMEKANRPTKTQTRSAIRSCHDLHELMETCRTDDDLGACDQAISQTILSLIALNTFHGLYLTDDQLLFDDYAPLSSQIIESLEEIGLREVAASFREELASGAQDDAAFQRYANNERKTFRITRDFCLKNNSILHDWIYREK